MSFNSSFFKISQLSNDMVDYPPERVSNLKAYFIEEDDIKIEFTATGEDLDNGQGILIYKIFTSYLIYEAVFSHNY